MLNENVVKLLKSGMWDLATCANGEPNVVPVAFKDVTPDGKLVVGDVFLDTTLKTCPPMAARSPFLSMMHRVWKAIRSKALRSMSPRAKSSRPLRLWWRKCLTVLLPPRVRSSSRRRRSSLPHPAQTTRKSCKSNEWAQKCAHS